MSTGDPEQPGGCLRRFLYKYVLGFKEPFTGSQKLGVQTHEEIEHNLRTGEMTLGHLAMTARHFIPKPHPSLMIEHKIQPGELFVAGIRVVGHIDLVQPWGWTHGAKSFYIDPTGEISEDPGGTTEITDWKTTSSIKSWAKTGIGLYKTIQMPTYAQWAMDQFDCSHIRLSHVYMQTRGRAPARKATILLDREKLSTRWEQIEGVARTLIDVAKETDPLKVPVNRRACPAFRGCPHRERCPRSSKETLADVFGITKARKIKQEKKDMSVEAELAALTTQQSAAGIAPPAPVAIPVAAAVSTDAYKAAIDGIEPLGKGFPNLGAAEASAYLAFKGLKPQAGPCAYDMPIGNTGQVYRVTVLADGSLKGSGEFATLPSLSMEQFVQLGGQVSAPAAPVGIVPPNVPASNPALASVPVAGFVKPDAPAVPPAATVPPPPINAPGDPGKPAFKKMKSPERLAECERLWEENRKLQAASGFTKVGTIAVTATTPSGLVLHINSLPSQPFDRLDDYIRGICKRLEEETGSKDIRCSPHQALDFGKWKGALAAMVRENQPEDGVYLIMTRGDEIAEVVANTLTESATTHARGL